MRRGLVVPQIMTTGLKELGVLSAMQQHHSLFLSVMCDGHHEDSPWPRLPWCTQSCWVLSPRSPN